jgi:beta-glucosidase
MITLASLALAFSLFQVQQPVTVIPAIDEGPTKAGSYDWMGRHNDVVNRVKKGNVHLIFIGDSITHGFNGELWKQYYEPRNAVNMGFGWDGTQHVLWRLQHGEIDGISPKVAVLLIGVNNIGWASPADTALGVEAVVQNLRTKLPNTQVLLLGVFPWKQAPDAPERGRIKDLNRRLAHLAFRPGVTFLNFGDKFLEADGSLSKEIMPDYLHLSAKGYRIWVDAMEPTLKKLMGES